MTQFVFPIGLREAPMQAPDRDPANPSSTDNIEPPTRGQDDDASENRLTRRVARCPQGTSGPVAHCLGGWHDYLQRTRAKTAAPRGTFAACGGGRAGPRVRASRRGAGRAGRPVLADGAPSTGPGGSAGGDLHTETVDADLGLGLEIALTTLPSEQGAPVVAPSRELPPCP